MLSQETLEINILNLMLRSEDTTRRIVNSGITEKHFVSISGSQSRLYYKHIFKMALMHNKKYGTLLSEEVFQNEIAKRVTSELIFSDFQKAWMTTQLSNATLDQLDYYIDELNKNAVKTKLMEIPEKLRNLGDPEVSPFDMAEEIKEHLYDTLSDFNIGGQQTKLLDIVGAGEKIKQVYSEAKKDYERVGGVKIGLPNIDDQTNGFRDGQLAVVIGGTGAGKSVTMLNWAIKANEMGHNVLFFSWEMPMWQCIARFMACKRREPYLKFKNFSMSQKEESQFFEYIDNMAATSDAYFIFVDQPDNCTVDEIETNYKQLKAAGRPPDIIFVDYLGNMAATDPVRGQKDWEIESQVAIKLRSLSRKYGIPFITAQQISKDGLKENRKKGESDKSGAISIATDQVSGPIKAMYYADYAFGIIPQFNTESGQNLMWYHKIKGRDIHFESFAAAYHPECCLISPIQQNHEVVKFFSQSPPADNEQEICPADFTNLQLFMADEEIGDPI